MKLILNNIGLIEDAEINLHGITIIGGDNNTGKSTVGKALFAILDGLNGLDRRVKYDFYEKIKDILKKGIPAHSLTVLSHDKIVDFAQDIIKKSDEYLDDLSCFYERLKEFYTMINPLCSKEESETLYKRITDEIANILKVSMVDLYKASFARSISEEFHQQVGNIYTSSESCIVFEDEDFSFKICLKDNVVINIIPELNIEHEGNVVYIDDSLVLDRLPYNGRNPRLHSHNHQEQLISNLIKNDHELNLVDDVVIKDKLSAINTLLSQACDGTIVRDNLLNYSYCQDGSGKNLCFNNVSTGLKTFILLKTLLLNGSLSVGGTIILDEPEVHLHPKWQLLFAEIIVLLQKQLTMRILLNTHSPYFLRAIQVYSAKHGIADKCTYYLSDLEDGHAVIRDTTNNIEAIYAKLAEPFQQLEDARWQDD